MIIDQDTSAPKDFLERSAVPLHFPQFRNSGALAHLAHIARGPRYVLVGGKAWYDPDDIRAWLEANKRCGPAVGSRSSKPTNSGAVSAGPKKRGRPTKFEQMKRRAESVVAALEA
jgi:hypothetical protein